MYTVGKCHIACNLVLNIRACISLCHSDERVKAVGPFYLVSMPGEVKHSTRRVNVVDKKDQCEDRVLNAYHWQSVLGVCVASHDASVVHDVAILRRTFIPTRQCKHYDCYYRILS